MQLCLISFPSFHENSWVHENKNNVHLANQRSVNMYVELKYLNSIRICYGSTGQALLDSKQSIIYVR